MNSDIIVARPVHEIPGLPEACAGEGDPDPLTPTFLDSGHREDNRVSSAGFIADGARRWEKPVTCAGVGVAVTSSHCVCGSRGEAHNTEAECGEPF